MVLAVVAAFTLSAPPAVADTGSLTGNAVAAFGLDPAARVGPSSGVVPGQGREAAGSSYDSATGCRVATRAPGISNERPVVFNRPKAGSTSAQDAQIRSYVEGCNAALCDGALSPTGRVSTQGSLQQRAGRAAAAERSANPSAYGPGQHAGHVPDTTWTGSPDPHSWMALEQSINTSLGAQAGQYPIGYQPTGFWFIDDYIAQFGGPP